MKKVIPRYEDNKTYPILVMMNGHCKIVEMLGVVANKYNDYIKDNTIHVQYVRFTV